MTIWPAFRQDRFDSADLIATKIVKNSNFTPSIFSLWYIRSNLKKAIPSF